MCLEMWTMCSRTGSDGDWRIFCRMRTTRPETYKTTWKAHQCSGMSFVQQSLEVCRKDTWWKAKHSIYNESTNWILKIVTTRICRGRVRYKKSAKSIRRFRLCSAAITYDGASCWRIVRGIHSTARKFNLMTSLTHKFMGNTRRGCYRPCNLRLSLWGRRSLKHQWWWWKAMRRRQRRRCITNPVTSRRI
jgi:hypothetical protein